MAHRFINQNQPYDLKQQFDLVLHLAVLCHIENWKQDLESALKHTNLMFLESMGIGC
jgi:2-polyprenyl-3-methyl-5-hydroxy-6-metoxy-1,4-benzoquinol methylase